MSANLNLERPGGVVGEGGPASPSEGMADKLAVGSIATGLGIEATRVRPKEFTIFKDPPILLRLRTLGDGPFDVDGPGGAN